MADLSDRSLECEVCCEPFDHAVHRPKLLSCGHTVCLGCVRGIFDKAQSTAAAAPSTFPCPIDRRETRGRPEELNDNYYIMSLIQGTPRTETPRGASSASGGQPNFWCLECKAVADGVCVDKHDLRRLHKERSRQIKPTLDLLERAVGTQRRLAQKLEDTEAAVRDFVKQQLAETRAAAARNQELLTRLYDSLDLVGPEWDVVQTAAEQASRSSEKTLAQDEESLQLLASTGKCEVKMRGGDGAWRADVDLAADVEGMAVVRGLLVHMHRAGMLRSDQTPAPPAAAAPTQPPAVTSPRAPLVAAAPAATPLVPTRAPQVAAAPPAAAPLVPTRAPLVAAAAPPPAAPLVPTRAPQVAAAPPPSTPLVPTRAPLVAAAAPPPAAPLVPTRAPLVAAAPAAKLPAATPAPPLPPGAAELLSELSRTLPGERRAEKDAALRDHSEITSLDNFCCNRDPAWACAVLHVVGPCLETLSLTEVGEEHVRALGWMRNLKTLALRNCTAATTSGYGQVAPPNLQEIKLDVASSDVAQWISKLPAPSVHIVQRDDHLLGMHLSTIKLAISGVVSSMQQKSAGNSRKKYIMALKLIRSVDLCEWETTHDDMCLLERRELSLNGTVHVTCSICQ